MEREKEQTGERGEGTVVKGIPFVEQNQGSLSMILRPP